MLLRSSGLLTKSASTLSRGSPGPSYAIISNPRDLSINLGLFLNWYSEISSSTCAKILESQTEFLDGPFISIDSIFY